MSRWIVLDLASALTIGCLAVVSWGYPWQLAVLTGVAVGSLTYATRRTYLNLRQIQRQGYDSLDDSEDAR